MPKLPLSTQLLQAENANAELAEMNAQLTLKINTLTKDLEREKANTAAHYKSRQEADAEIEQIHQMLDAVPNAVARESNEESTYNRTKRSALTRLAAWIASK